MRRTMIIRTMHPRPGISNPTSGSSDMSSPSCASIVSLPAWHVKLRHHPGA
jgi:hypothetical protein